MIRRVLASDRAATAVEFALVAPIFLGALFGLIESGRAVWTRQALQQAASAGARCLALGTGCSDAATASTYTIGQARRAGVKVTTSQVTSVISTTCNGQGSMSRVVIRQPFVSPAAGFLPASMTAISIAACFPRLAA
jgi:Flp pilus assembly protein TadG